MTTVGRVLVHIDKLVQSAPPHYYHVGRPRPFYVNSWTIIVECFGEKYRRGGDMYWRSQLSAKYGKATNQAMQRYVESNPEVGMIGAVDGSRLHLFRQDHFESRVLASLSLRRGVALQFDLTKYLRDPPPGDSKWLDNELRAAFEARRKYETDKLWRSTS